METNFYTTASPREKDLLLKEKHSDVFDYLLQKIKSQLVLIHGRKAVQAMERKLKMPITGPMNANLNGNMLILFPSGHLSYQFSKEKAKDLAKALHHQLNLNR